METINHNDTKQPQTINSHDLISILNEVIDLDLLKTGIGLGRRTSLDDALICFAQNIKTPQSILEKLAKKKHASSEMLLSVASHPNTPRTAFESICENLNSLGKEHLIENPELPLECLDYLAGDEEENVRCAVAACVRTPSSTLEKLAFSSDWLVQSELVRNPNTSTRALILMLSDSSSNIKTAIAHHPNATQVVLDKLSEEI